VSTLLFVNAAQVVTCTTSDEGCVRAGAAVLVLDGRIAAIDEEAVLAASHPSVERIDCAGGVLTPGFVDSHTHAVFGRYRADEYALRSSGVPYMEIARRGGGINASVRDLRARSEHDLVELTRPRLQTMLRLGTTTAEVKSGYGLSTMDELKELRAVHRLAAELPIRLVPTLLAAHEVPPEFRDRRDAYVDLVCDETIPAVAAEKLARFCDVFMEPGVFDAQQTRRILEAGLAHGMTPKLHADELEGSGAAELAADLNAASADHLGAISEAGIRALAESWHRSGQNAADSAERDVAFGTVATLLPGTLFFLGRTHYAPARALLAAGARIAIASDFNPGSSPSPNMALVMTMACSQMGLSPIEALHAATAGGAAALRLTDGCGTLQTGAPADLVMWDVADYGEIPYRYGLPPVAGVWVGGKRVAGRL
jgi:imidazolonepropionase